MQRRDLLDASTLDSRRRRRRQARVASVRVVFRPEAGIVSEPAQRLAAGFTSMGRASSGIALYDDRRASREHARLAYQPDAEQLDIEDLDSKNGVFVNGRRVDRARLDSGDVVRVGDSLLVVRLEPPHQLDVPVESLIGVSPAMCELRVAVKRVAASGAAVLIRGETGTGKELVARAIHAGSARGGPFVAVNCSAISPALAEAELFGHQRGAFTGALDDRPGLFRAARHGTLFLDEIGDLAPALQPKLLRAIETGEVIPVGGTEPLRFEARVLAATHRNLEEAVAEGTFRADLLARLAQLRVSLPPLRARREDILAILARHLPGRALEPDLAEALVCHPWPRNVRELIAVATELSVMGQSLPRLELDLVRERLAPLDRSAEDEGDAAAPVDPRQPPPGREELLALLREHRGNVTKLAAAIGRSRTQAYRLLEQHGLDARAFR